MNTLSVNKMISALLLCLISSPLWAIDLSAAKQQGLIGERNDGYLGYVIEPPRADIKVLVKGVNNKRRAHYQKIAGKNQISLEQIQTLSAQKTLNKTVSGNYYQSAQGQWVIK